jgi:hypothetical protein
MNAKEIGKFKMKKSQFIENEVIANRTSRLSCLFGLLKFEMRRLDLNMALISKVEKTVIKTRGTHSLFNIYIAAEIR